MVYIDLITGILCIILYTDMHIIPAISYKNEA